jgi:GNAT superfamily N-acetyltransferase
MKIVRAKPEDATTLTAIALSAKRSWRYSERWLEIWQESLTVRAEFIVAHETYAAVVTGRIVGFYALRCEGSRCHLEHLWVLPVAMKQGVGRALFTHAVEHTKVLGSRALEIESDPNAEGFYQRLGARRVGINIVELDGQVRELPVLVYDIAPASLENQPPSLR